MTIDTLEKRYQALQADFKQGRLSRADFLDEVDRLSFYDDQGRFWLMGAQSGQWYYHDGTDWIVGDPRTLPDPAAQTPPPPEPAPAIPAEEPVLWRWVWRLGAAGTAVATLLLVLLVLPLNNGPATAGPSLAPSPRPPLDRGGGGGGDGGGGGGGDGTGNLSAIYGILTNLSTGDPGAGLEISVNGQIVRTDTDGSYSITGLPAGQYTIVPNLRGDQGIPQAPTYVNLDGSNTAVVDLSYYSGSRPEATDTPGPTGTPQAIAVAGTTAPSAVEAASAPAQTPVANPTPAALPQAGGPDTLPQPWLIAGLGLLLLASGGAIRLWAK